MAKVPLSWYSQGQTEIVSYREPLDGKSPVIAQEGVSLVREELAVAQDSS